MKKDIAPQETAQNIIRLAEEVSDGGKRDTLNSEIVNRDENFSVKVQQVN